MTCALDDYRIHLSMLPPVVVVDNVSASNADVRVSPNRPAVDKTKGRTSRLTYGDQE